MYLDLYLHNLARFLSSLHKVLTTFFSLAARMSRHLAQFYCRKKNEADWIKFKEFAGDKQDTAQMKNFLFDKVEYIVGNYRYEHFFFLFLKYCQKSSLPKQ